MREDGDVNSSFLETVSVLLTVLSPNDTSGVEEDDSSTSLFLNNTANSTTTEPEYYDDHILTTSSSTLSELGAVAGEDVEDDLDTLASGSSVHLGNSTESSLLSSLITDEMEVADSLDESVTATMIMTVKTDGKDMSGNENGTTAVYDDDDGNRSRSSGNNILKNDSVKDIPSATDDDSIIIVSKSSNLNVDKTEPISSHHVINADETASTKQDIISSTLSSPPELVGPTHYTSTDTATTDG